MTPNDDGLIYPEPRTPDAEYEAALESWDVDLDGTCIVASLTMAVQQGLCDLVGEDFYTDPGVGDDAFIEEAGRSVAALIRAGLLRREWFSYDETRGLALR